LVAIHLWIATRWRSFAVAMGVGIGLTVCGVILVSSKLAGYYPWTLPAILVNAFRQGNVPWRLILYGSGMSTLTAILSTWDFTRRDV
jgi:hypothetical protein